MKFCGLTNRWSQPLDGHMSELMVISYLLSGRGVALISAGSAPSR